GASITRAGRKTTVSISATHEYWRYSQDNLRDVNALVLGIGGSYQINKWLFLDNSYSQIVKGSDQSLQSTNIHRLRVGGLRFRSRKGLEVSMGGGIDVMRYQGVSSTGSIDAGISYDSSATTIGLVYHRGFSSIVGVGGVVQGDGVA